jgi:methionyl-tRNA formyltransferase
MKWLNFVVKINNMSNLTTLLLLTSRFYAKKLIDMSVEKSPDIAVIYVEHPNELLQFGEEFLSHSRLISFGSRFYVKSEILKLIGFNSYNFHPGPSTYPGWAPFNFALYDKAPKYGVTLHEMTADIDTGLIVGCKDFAIPENCDVQQLMDLTTDAMYELFDDFINDFTQRQSPLSSIGIQWSGHITSKKDFENMCHLSLDISEKELNRRLHAFGSSDGINLPYLMVDGQKYMIAFPEDPIERTSYYLHQHRFIKIGS